MSYPLEKFIEQAVAKNHSEEYILACIDYINNLSAKSYPVIFSIEHLAQEIDLQSSMLKMFIGETNNSLLKEEYKYLRYGYFKLRKRDGNYREIMSPGRDLKYIQKWILVNILEKYPLHNSCKGFRKGISIYHNAVVHEKSEIILKIDLLKFYDTITEKRVYGVFKAMGYVENLAYSLAKFTTAKHRSSYWESFDEQSKIILKDFINQEPSILPQGAPTSPMLANVVASKMDNRFENLGEKLKFNYSRYADDMTFSINSDGQLPSLDLIYKIISEEGFFVNIRKTKYMKKGCKQYVTGLTTTNGVNVSKKYRKRISQHIHYCRIFGVSSHLERNVETFGGYNNLRFHDWLYGHICFIKSINEKASAKLLEDFKKINWFV